MRHRNWSDLVMAAMIALCVAIVAEPHRSPSAADAAATPAAPANVAEAARSLAVAVLLTGERNDDVQVSVKAPDARSVANRAMTNAAEAAGQAARDIEMPFFSFGGDAGAE